jgi:hypothetical protein
MSAILQAIPAILQSLSLLGGLFGKDEEEERRKKEEERQRRLALIGIAGQPFASAPYSGGRSWFA